MPHESLAPSGLRSALASRRALELAGIHGPVVFTENAEVICDPDGTPTGEVREWAAIAMVEGAMPPLTHAQKLDHYHRQMREFAKVGITSVANESFAEAGDQPA